MKRQALLAGLGLTFFALTGCNTVKGVGKDLQATGGAVAEASEEVSDHLFGEEKTTAASKDK